MVKKQLASPYSEISQIEKEKVITIEAAEEGYCVTTNKNKHCHRL